MLTLIVPAVVGLIYGFLNIIMSIGAWGIALFLAIELNSFFSPMLLDYVESEMIRDGLAFLGVFILCLIIFSALGYFMIKLLGRAGLTVADRVLGLILGAGLGAIIVTIMVFLAGFTDLSQTIWWQESLTLGPFERMAIWSRQFLPENLTEYHHYG